MDGWMDTEEETACIVASDQSYRLNGTSQQFRKFVWPDGMYSLLYTKSTLFQANVVVTLEGGLSFYKIVCAVKPDALCT
jgi:hypothetical protein